MENGYQSKHSELENNEKRDSQTRDGEEFEPCTGPKNIALTISKIIGAFGFLLLFIASLGMLSNAFIVLGGAGLNEILAEAQDLLNNPFCGLIIGILLTVAVQSSSTSTSIFITMTGSKLITVHQAIFMVMGANVGTSITSTLVAFGNSAEKEEFSRSMSAAVVLAAKNWLTVFVLFPVEMISYSIAGVGFLEWLTGLCTQGINDDSGGGEKMGGFSLTKWFTNLFLNVRKKGLGVEDFPLTFVAYCRTDVTSCSDDDYCIFGSNNENDKCDISGRSGECYTYDDVESYEGGVTCQLDDLDPNATFYKQYGYGCIRSWHHMFMYACWSDVAVGGTVLAISLIFMFFSLAMIVKCLKSILAGSIRNLIANVIDKDLPYVPFLTSYLYIFCGIGLTIAVQSSSIILSILTPLCGLGIISLERAYPVTIGCDIGTTFTGLIAAFANPGEGFRESMQVSMSHLFFNACGFLLWFIIPFMRKLPIGIAKFAGRRTAMYRWWAVNYIVGFFFVLPVGAFLISIASALALTIILIIVLVLVLFICSINAIRTTECGNKCLPSFLISWKWLPVWCRSLAPYDPFCSCQWCCNKVAVDDNAVDVVPVTDNDIEKDGNSLYKEEDTSVL